MNPFIEPERTVNAFTATPSARLQTPHVRQLADGAAWIVRKWFPALSAHEVHADVVTLLSGPVGAYLAPVLNEGPLASLGLLAMSWAARSDRPQDPAQAVVEVEAQPKAPEIEAQAVGEKADESVD